MNKYVFIITFSLIVGCGESQTSDTTAIALDNVSSNPDIQQGYENCVHTTRKELRADNPDTPADIMKFLDEGALQTCHSAIVITCNKDPASYSCQLILDMYPS
ncbi:MAG: hypothetical protein KBT88_05590 [Gammaproteobacteria bacterium]|nr:hypothetical protein [Gammaproteobacteria bacterium]MBQ0839241.1 hypothetical protein [Gammaproteobacteria bacterium]